MKKPRLIGLHSGFTRINRRLIEKDAISGRRVSLPAVFPAVLYHGHTCIKSAHAAPASTLWFIKVVCTLCIHHSKELAFLEADYFRGHLTPYVACDVVCHMNSRLNMPDLAFSFFRRSRLSLNLIHLEFTFDLLLWTLCQIGLHRSAKVVFECMKADGFSPKSSDLDFLVSSFANAGEFGVAQEILIARAEVCCDKEEVVSSFVYNNFLRILINRKLIDEALLFFRGHILRLRSFSPDTCSFNIVISGLCRVRMVEKAFEFLDVMRNFGCDPDLTTFNTLVNGWCIVGKVDRAEQLLREVKIQFGVSPDVVTYTSVISGLCKSGKMDTAASLFDEMINDGIKPNSYTFNALIDGFGKKGEVASARRIYERMVSDGVFPDVTTFTSLIHGHCCHGELEQGLILWDKMSERKVTPNVRTFSVLISALCKENRLNEARALLRQLNRRDDLLPPPAFVYNPIIDGFCKAGNVDEANLIAVEMKARGCTHDKMTFTILIIGYCMKGRISDANGIYKDMLSVGCAPDNITVSTYTSCLRKAGMAREANEIENGAPNSVHSGLSSSQKQAPLHHNNNVTVAV